jgi:hypothetical protein
MKSVSVLREQLRKLLAFAARPSVGAGARNAIYNVSDQMATPVLMVVAARFLTTHMGFEQFGVWVLVLALTGSLAVFNFGLGDATIKFISQDRGTGNMGSVARTFRVNLTMGTLLGVAAALALLLGAPMIARHVFGASAASFATDVHAIGRRAGRIGLRGRRHSAGNRGMRNRRAGSVHDEGPDHHSGSFLPARVRLVFMAKGFELRFLLLGAELGCSAVQPR